MDKTYTSKDMRGKKKGGLIWKNDGMRDLDHARRMMTYD